MIDKKELRIGNTIAYGSHILTVAGIRQDGYVTTVENIDGYLEEYDSIPLSPQILKDFGFRVDHVSKHDYKQFKLKTIQTSYNLSGWLDDEVNFEVISTSNDKDDTVNYNTTTVCAIKSLHQLQNIFFIQTRYELENNK